ncbi:MAG: 4Fe-4S binding protein [Symbiobacteriaceae bacterium]|nr:4Fe-4S binding protein [Symbiobacteriaceae bacterium]
MKYRTAYPAPLGAAGLHIINTGDWRTLRPLLNKEKCLACGLCFLYCPVGSVQAEDGYRIDYSYCKGCGICARECPGQCITMVPEGGKDG